MGQSFVLVGLQNCVITSHVIRWGMNARPVRVINVTTYDQRRHVTCCVTAKPEDAWQLIEY
jgi:hypothetical protein